jgi:immunoglobulin-binding protein 1
LAEIQLQIHNTFHTLDIIAQELKILSFAPPTPPTSPTDLDTDSRERQRQHPSSYSDRVDHSLSQFPRGNGPILNKDGRPLQPFTLLSGDGSNDRQNLRKGVFRSGHSLPTMTIDEYLAEEKRRGGMVEGGGEPSRTRPEPDEDDFDREDQETMKAREWDEFKEDNPRGSGNTLNRG